MKTRRTAGAGHYASRASGGATRRPDASAFGNDSSNKTRLFEKTVGRMLQSGYIRPERNNL
ncbi:MAG: hypothetical protein WCZ18_11190 [Ottowia sp.]|nr:hypothetical protein [Ottowia sp.]